MSINERWRMFLERQPHTALIIQSVAACLWLLGSVAWAAQGCQMMSVISGLGAISSCVIAYGCWQRCEDWVTRAIVFGQIASDKLDRGGDNGR